MDRIAEITRDCFNAVAQLRAADVSALPPPERIHARLRGFVDDLLHRAGAAGFGREESNDIAYPVVALADEVMAGKDSDTIRAHWTAQPLQFHYFGENVAGEGFFERLERIRRDPRRKETLRAYYLALAFGFQGRYRVRGGELELLGLTEALAHEVLRESEHDSDALSPYGERPPDRGGSVARRGIVLWVALGLLAASGLLYLGLRISLAAGTSEVVDRITALAAR